jgi:hypothetical protein
MPAAGTGTTLHTRGLFRLLLLGGCCLAAASVPAVNHDGDINADDAVDLADLLWGYQVLMNTRTLGPVEALHADVAPLADGIPAPDGTFDLGDVAVLLPPALAYGARGVDDIIPPNAGLIFVI